ncbi:CBS domain-containing protein [bacterium]|nr:CBS domain-containing protein [bacterium]
MESKIVKEMMIPLAEYTTVSEDANLLEAVMALEKAQVEFDQTGYRHRAILVLDQNGHIVGKVSQHDILIALELNYKKIEENEKGTLSRFGLSNMFIKYTMKEYNLWDKPLDHLCKKAMQRNVKEFMYAPMEGEFIDENETMNNAVHKLIIGKHHSLLVTQRGKIAGVLRLSDVFEKITDLLKEC